MYQFSDAVENSQTYIYNPYATRVEHDYWLFSIYDWHSNYDANKVPFTTTNEINKFTAYQSNTSAMRALLDSPSPLGYMNSGTSGNNNFYASLVNGTAPKMQNILPIEGVLELMNGDNIWIDGHRDGGFGQLSVDDLLYDEFLRYAVDYSLAGDLLHAHTPIASHGQSDILGDSPYVTQVQNNGNMAHVAGVGDEWHMSRPIVNNKMGGDLLADLLSLYYKVEALNDVAYNQLETYAAAVSYTHLTLPTN